MGRKDIYRETSPKDAHEIAVFSPQNNNKRPPRILHHEPLLPTVYIVRREGNVFTRVCPSIHPSVHTQGGGGTLARSSWGGGTPPWVPPIRPGQGGTLTGGTPPQVPPGQTWPGGTPPWVPPIRPCRGTPPWVPPPRWTWLEGTLTGGTPPWVPPIRPCGGYPDWGVPHLGYHPVRPGCGGTPTGGHPTSYRITDGVLDTPRSVCLLRSRRRTFLWRLF